ncbi:Oligopeptidase A [Halioglobus japonicus]|nr:Oligopeptidase A [Halioglobus japonicus]
MSNPLLEPHTLPPFSRIEPAHVEPAIGQLIERNKQRIEELLASTDTYSWDNLLQPIEELDDELSSAWSPVSHLNSVCNSDALREAYNACLPLLSEYGTWTGQHSGLYAAYQQIADSDGFDKLDTAQRKSVEHALRDFRLAGVALPKAKKKQYGELRQRLSKLGSTFGENVLDATNAWSKQVSREDLAGLPETALASAQQAAKQAGLEGYLINLEFPSLSPVLNYCDNRELREEVYTANCTRASEQGPHAGQWDNSSLIVEILELRTELAKLLGFDNYAELSLATKMADSADTVMEFLQQLAAQSLPQAEAEFRELVAFASAQSELTTLEAWDVSYYSEKLRQSRYQVSQEDIRPYLPADKVLLGLFEVVRRLYGVDIREVEAFDNYHPSVKLFELLRGEDVIAHFYLDLYARANKRGGAWMDNCRVRRLTNEGLQIPVAYLVCNFTPPVEDKPALLTHTELTTLFHEFGHGLHHMLTRQTVAAVSGINGVAWDAVELPSQFLENWCWEREALAFISGHWETGEPLPEELLDKLLAARNFQSGMMMVRQLEFSLFDFRLHREWGSGSFDSVQSLLDEVRQLVGVITPPAFNRFQNAFSHIFAGGYAAGYYSYKWAEVLSADAFSRFEEEGIFNEATGTDFRTQVLEVGGSREPMEVFVAFRGREPSINALLRHSGITG